MSAANVTPEEVLSFWFGPPGGEPFANAAKWYRKDDAFDLEIKERFEAALEAGAKGELASWKADPRGRLALVVLLDQMSRNMFRGSPRAFAQDRFAVDVALASLDDGDEASFSIQERQFLYMPLMHAENVDLQRRCSACFERLRNDGPAELREKLDSNVKYARMHADIVERFGRFPHRNAVLGRPSTPEEEAFLKQPGSSF